MAMALRARSNLSIFQNLLRAESVLTQRSTFPSTSSENPNLTTTQLSRNFASTTGSKGAAAAPKETKVKLPLALFGGAGNYASALYIAAVKANTLDKVETEIADIVAALTKSPKFSQFIMNLSIPAQTRVKAVTAIASEANFSEITKNFLVVLAQNGRLRNIHSVAKKFTELTMAHKGVVKAIVTTVIPLPAEEEKDLKDTLQEILGAGKTVKLEQKIDPNILGGLVVEFDLKVFDMSIRTRARQMERFLREPVNFASIA